MIRPATAARAARLAGKTSRGRRLPDHGRRGAALFVGSAAFAGRPVGLPLPKRTVVATKLMVARTAANTSLWLHAGEHGHPGRSGRESPQRLICGSIC